ncbi:MAG: hypothetical protein PWR10_457 [Halanaerobiales bacterium]|nr:hypothetical protein [Halanaerobiales bacterium]
MNEKEFNPVISYLNYKDILIILGLWYFMAAFNILAKEIKFDYTLLTNIFHFLFILTGRFIYLALVIFYLTSLYPISFKDLGINFSNFKRQILLSFSLVFCLLISVILLINIPLSFIDKTGFTPLYRINNPEVFINSLIPLALLFLANLLTGFSELFLLTNFVLELFNYTIFNRLISVLLASLFYSVILLHFSPSRILVNFIIALISLFLYLKTDSLIISSFFMAGYYSIYIFYIYGWGFIRF